MKVVKVTILTDKQLDALLKAGYIVIFTGGKK